MADQKREAVAAALAEAERFEGWAAGGPPFARGERIYLELAAVTLVEGLDLRSLDHGSVTVTDRRMIFDGASRRREWAFTKLAGHQHLDDRATLLQVTNRRRVSGIRYRDDDGDLFRRRLAIAVARAAGQGDALVASLRAQLGASGPDPLPGPDGRPARRSPIERFRGWPRWARIGGPVMAVTVLLVSLTGGGGDPGRGGTIDVAVERPRSSEVIDPPTTSTMAVPATVAPTAPPTTTTTVAPTTTTTVAPTTTTTVVPPPPPSTVAFVAPAPGPAPGPAPAGNGCHPSYEPCLPVTDDLDCGDISGSVRVVGPDDYRLDRDGDGTGCES